MMDGTSHCNRHCHACHDRTFVATSLLLSRQTRIYRDKTRLLSLAGSATSIILVATNILSRQMRVCNNKTFVATKIILVAAPANDIVGVGDDDNADDDDVHRT